MRRVIGVATVILSAIVIGMAVANRHTVVVYFDPWRDPDRMVEVPVYAALLGALACGVVLGGLAAGRRRALRPRDMQPTRGETRGPARRRTGSRLLT